MDAARARKLADRISQIVAEMLERRIKDPRLGFVTVTEARLTNDLREATVFYTVYGTDAELADTAAALDSATGIIRSEVGRQLGLRHTPSLEFVADVLPENAQRIEELVTRARQSDSELARVREVDHGNPGRVLGQSAVLRQTGLITSYSVRTSTFRSHIAVPHEPARTSSRPPDTRGSARRHESSWASEPPFEPPGAAGRI
jgi:ribosome-binding factor A